jgi:hypothetical protein
MAQSSNVVENIRDKMGESSPRREGKLTRTIEKQTARMPSAGWLGLAVGSMLISASIAFFSRRKEYANFVGLWAPSLLLIGIYNKLVKLEGSDAFDRQDQAA